MIKYDLKKKKFEDLKRAYYSYLALTQHMTKNLGPQEPVLENNTKKD